MVVERITVNSAFFNNFLDCNFIQRLFIQERNKCRLDSRLGKCRHSVPPENCKTSVCRRIFPFRIFHTQYMQPIATLIKVNCITIIQNSNNKHINKIRGLSHIVTLSRICTQNHTKPLFCNKFTSIKLTLQCKQHII